MCLRRSDNSAFYKDAHLHLTDSVAIRSFANQGTEDCATSYRDVGGCKSQDRLLHHMSCAWLDVIIHLDVLEHVRSGSNSSYR